MRDGTIKKIFHRIKQVPRDDNRFRLTYKPYNVIAGRAFGVELEICHPSRPGLIRDDIERVLAKKSIVTGWSNKTTTKAWKVSTDNSIVSFNDDYGVEIVSPILRGEGGLDQLRKVAQDLSRQGATANASCGLHVHVDLTGVDFDALKRICQNWLKYEEAFDLLLPFERREAKNKYCLNVRQNMRSAPLSNTQAHQLISQQTTIEGLAKVMNAHPESRNRYFKLNMQNLIKKDNPRSTIEFRGPLNSEIMVELATLPKSKVGSVLLLALSRRLSTRRRLTHLATRHWQVESWRASTNSSETKILRPTTRRIASDNTTIYGIPSVVILNFVTV